MSGQRETLDSTVSFESSFFQVLTEKVRLPDGSVRDYYTVKHPGAVAVVPVDQEGRILMVRQYRQAAEDNLLELPAGKLDPGEDPSACARRELAEETGFVCEHLELLASYFTSPGFTDEKVHVFEGRELRKVEEPPGSDGGEPLSIEWLDRQDVLSAIYDGRIVDGKTIIGIALLKLREHPENHEID
jgi:ADP-ribose diphosphatase